MEKCPVCDWPMMVGASGLYCSNLPERHELEAANWVDLILPLGDTPNEH